MRAAITGVALAFTCGLGFMTVYVMLESGPDVLTGIGVVVVATMAFGILGALTER